MTTPQQTTQLAETFSRVLEDLAFMFTETGADITPGCVWLEGQIAYDGSRRGRLTLQCPRDFAIQLAANLLGVEPDDPEVGTRAADALRELMNITCGQLVTTLYGTDDVFTLSIPTVRELDATPPATTAPGRDAVLFSVEGHPLRLVHEPRD